MFKKIFKKKLKPWEARKFKRLRASYLVKYQMGEKGAPRITNLVDISEGGLRFLAHEKIPELSLLRLSIYLPPLERSVDAVSKVTRVRRARDGEAIYYVSVIFLDLKGRDREAIRQFAEYISKQKETPFLIDPADIAPRRPGKR